MSAKELIEYLQGYPEDSSVSFIVGDPKDRKLYPVIKIGGITDCENAVLMIEVGKPEDMEEC